MGICLFMDTKKYLFEYLEKNELWVHKNGKRGHHDNGISRKKG